MKRKFPTGLLGIHVAVVVQVLIVHGEPGRKTTPQADADAGNTLAFLTHPQHGVVEYALWALCHRVHPNRKDNVDGALEVKGEARIILEPSVILIHPLISQSSILKGSLTQN